MLTGLINLLYYPQMKIFCRHSISKMAPAETSRLQMHAGNSLWPWDVNSQSYKCLEIILFCDIYMLFHPKLLFFTRHKFAWSVPIWKFTNVIDTSKWLPGNGTVHCYIVTVRPHLIDVPRHTRRTCGFNGTIVLCSILKDVVQMLWITIQ